MLANINPTRTLHLPPFATVLGACHRGGNVLSEFPRVVLCPSQTNILTLEDCSFNLAR